MFKTISNFKKSNTFEKRQSESQRINIKYKDRVPIIVEVNSSCEQSIVLDKYKYLVPLDLTVSQFLYVIRKRVKLRLKLHCSYFSITVCRHRRKHLEVFISSIKTKMGFYMPLFPLSQHLVNFKKKIIELIYN